MPFRAKSALICLVLVGLILLRTPAAGSVVRTLAGSVRLPEADGRSIGRARILRSLSAAELSAPISFSVSLRMRDFPGLRERLDAGAQVSRSEMEARYFPLATDYARVAAWLSASGFEPTLPDVTHTSVFVRGTVADVARAFGIQFARVAVSDGDYTSAISEPAVPEELAPLVLSVNGLQPQFRLRHLPAAVVPEPRDLVATKIYITPDNVAQAYNVPNGAAGAGQIIAVIGEGPPAASDLALFWSAVGSAQVAANVKVVNVDGGNALPGSGATQEADLDVEWAGAIAPAAGIRVYVATQTFECFAQVLNDLSAYPSLSVLSISYGGTEGQESAGVLQSYSQVTASLAAAGVTIIAASGDSGSNPNGGINPGNYLASAPLEVSYPASDPSATGIGGSNLTFTGNWAYSVEAVWNQLASTQSGSGGGVSMFFPKPSWQTGGSLLAGQTMRCVPDVAAIADGSATNLDLGPGYEPVNAADLGCLAYVNGTDTGIGGTSLSAPIWAGFVALLNQERAAANLGHIGLLNPHLYPLAGTHVFNDITRGTNGAYSAGPGYDLGTGLGTPNVANLIWALGGVDRDSHRLVNLSARVQVNTGANIMIAGFVISGAAGSTKEILVRGVGPALEAFGLTGVLANPVVSVYDSASPAEPIATDTGWENAPVPGTSSVAASYRKATAADMTAAGAFALASLDSALVLTLPVGSYTVQVSGAGSATGVGLAEVYELDAVPHEVLANLSSRSFVGTSAQVAIAGFVVSGSESAQLLIRGVGPALGGFGLTGFLSQPILTLYDSTNTVIATNTGWGNLPVAGTSDVKASYRPATAADMTSVGAFSLTENSADSALIVTLPPGSYTAQVSGAAGTTGTALAEVYQLPGP